MTIKINVFSKQQQKIQTLSIKELNAQDKKLQPLTEEELKKVVGGFSSKHPHRGIGRRERLA